MRSIDTCPYRIVFSESSDSEGAICQYLVEASGVSDHTLAAVRQDVCNYCCTQFEPRPGMPNPMVASLLFKLATKIQEADGVDGCTAAEADKLEQHALAHLEIVSSNEDGYQSEQLSYAGPCFYLGNEIGERACSDCIGRVTLKTFHCNHELHDETVIRDCRKCPDYDRRLACSGGAVAQWAVGVTTAPRRESNLEQSLKSLAQAGWQNPHVFAEPGTALPIWLAADQVTSRTRTLGAWPNFYVSLMELVMLEPRADAYLMCQDDVVYADELRAYLEDNLWPAETLGVISLHTACHQDRGDVDGFYAADLGWEAWGAQAYVFSNASARVFLRHARVLNHRNRGPRDGKCNVDSVVGQWCQDTSLSYFLHTPSLTQHIGETSTLWEKSRVKGRRRAATFEHEIPQPEKPTPATTAEAVFNANASAIADRDWKSASFAMVTIHIGRKAAFGKWSDWVRAAQVSEHTALYLMDNSKGAMLGDRLWKAIADASQFRSRTILTGPGMIKDRGLHREKCANIATALTQCVEKVTEDYVLIVDDDTIPPPDVLQKLHQAFHSRPSNCALISGAYESANQPGHLAASRSKKNWSERLAVGELRSNEIIEIGFVGSGCMFARTRLLKQFMPFETLSRNRGILGPDSYLCQQLTAHGYSIWLHGGVQCAHLFRE